MRAVLLVVTLLRYQIFIDGTMSQLDGYVKMLVCVRITLSLSQSTLFAQPVSNVYVKTLVHVSMTFIWPHMILFALPVTPNKFWCSTGLHLDQHI